MIKKELKNSGGSFYILEDGDTVPVGEIWFRRTEFDHAKRIGKSSNDPEAEKEFWHTIIEKKRANNEYSFFEDFPLEDLRTEVKTEQTDSEKYCAEIIQMLKGKKVLE